MKVTVQCENQLSYVNIIVNTIISCAYKLANASISHFPLFIFPNGKLSCFNYVKLEKLMSTVLKCMCLILVHELLSEIKAHDLNYFINKMCYLYMCTCTYTDTLALTTTSQHINNVTKHSGAS